MPNAIPSYSIHCLDSCLFTFTDFRGSCMPSLLGTDCANWKVQNSESISAELFNVYGFKKASSASKLQCSGHVFLQTHWLWNSRGNTTATQHPNIQHCHLTGCGIHLFFFACLAHNSVYMMQVVRSIKISRARQSSGHFPMAQLQLWTCSLLSTSFCFSDLWQSSCWQNKKVISDFFGSDSEPKNHLYKTSCHFCPKW